MKKLIYLSGKINNTDTIECYSKFYKAEEELALAGYKVINPLRFSMSMPYLNEETILKLELAMLKECDLMLIVGDTAGSRGVQVETDFALRNSIPVYRYETFL